MKKLSVLLLSFVFLASVAVSQTKEEAAKYAEYGFSVTLPDHVVLAHTHDTG